MLLCFVVRCGGAGPRARRPRPRCLVPSCADHGWPWPIHRPRRGPPRASAGTSVRAVRLNSAPCGQHVQDDPRGEDRATLLGLVGVGDHVAAVEERDRAAADDAQHLGVLGAGDDGGGVLVDAHAEQLRALGDDHQQPAVAVALGEVLVDDAVLDESEAGGDLGHPLLRGGAARSEGDHVRGLDARPGRRTADGDAAAAGLDDGVGERRTGDDRGQLELVATGHEDAGRSVELSHDVGGGGLGAVLGTDAVHLRGTELVEQRGVDVDDLGAQRGRRRDHRDPRVGAAGALHELGEHGALAELVLGSSDDEQVADSAPGWTVGSHWHDRKPKGWEID